MTKPAPKATNIWNMLNDISNVAYGRSTTESIGNDVCVRCGEPATVFTDALSRKEFSISGLCQKCQDFVFAPPPEEE